MDIDELEGVELAQVVARKQGMTQTKYIDWWDAVDEQRWCICTDASTYLGGPERSYRPDLSTDQAWELDGEGWEWHTHGSPSGLVVIVCSTDSIMGSAKVLWADFPDKLQAYATARCRAYLKAITASSSSR